MINAILCFWTLQMFGNASGPVLVLSQNTKRTAGRKVQTENIQAGKTIGDVIRTCLGPKAMLKMLMDPMGGIVMTNDGNAILREITVQHPAAKTMIEIARTQVIEILHKDISSVIFSTACTNPNFQTCKVSITSVLLLLHFTMYCFT